MKKLLFACGLLMAISACSLAPQATPALVQHDLGNGFRTLALTPLPLRNLSVSATPVVAGLNMYYREASRPTTRGFYTYNRWAAPPANLVDQALSRLLPVEPSGRCRLSVQLSDVILDIDAQGLGQALLAGTLRISLDGKNVVFKHIVDVRSPVASVDPAGEAIAMRQAVIDLAGQIHAWVSSPEIARYCMQA